MIFSEVLWNLFRLRASKFFDRWSFLLQFNQRRGLSTHAVDVLLSTYCLLGAILILCWVFEQAGSGFEVTDEGYYLNSISDPFLYDFSITQFGFIYYPFYYALNGDIPSLRRLDLLFTISIVFFLVQLFLKTVVGDQKYGIPQRLALSLGFSTASLNLDAWVPTPNYNTLVLDALVLTLIGALLARRNPSLASMCGWVLIGAGGWLAFMAKPSTAAVLAILVCGYLLLTNKLTARWAALSAGTVCSLLILSALIIDGSIIAFLERLRIAFEFEQLVKPGTLQRIVRIDRLYLNVIETLLLLALIAISAIAAATVVSESTTKRWLGVALATAAFAFVVFITLTDIQPGVELGQFRALLILAVPISGLALGLLWYGQKIFFEIPKDHWLLVLILLLLPYAYAFGSLNNYWNMAATAGIFWLLAGLIFVGPIIRRTKQWTAMLPLAVMTEAIVALLLLAAMAMPYRQDQATWLNKTPVEIGMPNSVVRVSDNFAQYIETAISSAKAAGFEAGTPVIDLTGMSPGIVYALRGESVGQPWFIGGFRKSLQRASASLKRVSCDKLALSWLLSEPNGLRAIDNSVLSTFGSSIAEDYRAVAVWTIPVGTEGHTQILYRPLRTTKDAVYSCENSR